MPKAAAAPLVRETHQLAVEYRSISDLVPYARNARTHNDFQIAEIAASMREFGWTNPVLIDEAGGLIAGHGRVLAGSRNGYQTAPCIVLSHLTEAQKRAYVLADNKIALNAGWDEDMLRSELQALSELGVDLGITGFGAEELVDLFEKVDKTPWKTGEDEAPPAPKRPVSKTGDVWLLGKHRVVCGNSRKEDALALAANGEKLAACWTDPPYNVDYQGVAGRIQSDSMSNTAFRALLDDAFVAAFEVLRPGAAIYVAHADTEGLNFRGAFAGAGFKTSGCLIWAKDSLVLGRSDYQWQHEPILYGWKPGAAHRWFGGRKQTTVRSLTSSAFAFNDDGTVTVTIGLEAVTISGRDLVAREAESSLVRVPKPTRSAEHPTMKPVALVSRMLRNSTREGDTVLDMFAGSGSTLIACEMLGRAARLVEIDPRFVDVIVRRWQNFTGKVATRESTGRPFPVPPDANAAE